MKKIFYIIFTLFISSSLIAQNAEDLIIDNIGIGMHDDGMILVWSVSPANLTDISCQIERSMNGIDFESAGQGQAMPDGKFRFADIDIIEKFIYYRISAETSSLYSTTPPIYYDNGEVKVIDEGADDPEHTVLMEEINAGGPKFNPKPSIKVYNFFYPNLDAGRD